MRNARWTIVPNEVNASAFTLFCFPYAGASATSLYARWQPRLPSGWTVRAVELPGRGPRIFERLQESFDALTSQLAGEVLAQMGPAPFGFFGHSLGALLAFEIAHILRGRGEREPVILFASGANAPARRDDARFVGALPDENLIEELRRLEGTCAAVLEHRELLELALPVLRADFRLCGLYRYRERPSLGCDIHVFAGERDSDCQIFQPWSRETSGRFGLDMLPGGHFFIHQQEAQLLPLIVRRGADALHRGQLAARLAPVAQG